MKSKTDKGSPRIAVFATHFQGDFIGDLANQIRQCCEFRKYKFIGFSTGGTGEYDCDFCLDELDGAIIICNSVSRDFAKKLLKRNIAAVSIAFDYYPLDIPVISSDNSKGAEIAFNYLSSKNHQQIVFVGDLSQYDIRKRFEHFSELMENNGFSLPEDHVINARNTDISGGLDAADVFFRRKLHVSAVFCAAGLTMIGFIKKLKELDAATTENLEFLGYDASPITPVLFPDTNSVVQNIHIIAYRALSIVIDAVKGEPSSERAVTIAPKLMENNHGKSATDSPYLATSVDLPEIYTPGYVSALMNNCFSWGNEIYETRLDDLMSLSPMFEKFMKYACFSQISRCESGRECTKTLSIYSLSNRKKTDRSAAENICDAAAFPPLAMRKLGVQSYDNATHFFIKAGKRNSCVLSLFGDTKNVGSIGSFLYFCGQMDIVMKFMSISMQARLAKTHSTTEGAKPRPPSSYAKHPVVWRVKQNTTDWSKEALALMDLTNPLDINIYCHMDIIDRAHPDDSDQLRKLAAQCAVEGDAFDAEIRLKSKQGHYVDVSLSGEAKRDSDGHVVEVVFSIGSLDTV